MLKSCRNNLFLMQVRDLGFQMFYFFHIVWTLKDCLLFPLRISREWWWHFIPIIWFFCLVFPLTNRDESVLILLLSLKSHFLSVIFFSIIAYFWCHLFGLWFFLHSLKISCIPFSWGVESWDHCLRPMELSLPLHILCILKISCAFPSH